MFIKIIEQLTNFYYNKTYKGGVLYEIFDRIYNIFFNRFFILLVDSHKKI